MKRELLLPLSIFALAGAISLHALRPAHAQAVMDPDCEGFGGATGAQVEKKVETWLKEQRAAGRQHFITLDYTVCAW